MAPLPEQATQLRTVTAILRHYAENRADWDSIGVSISTLGEECDRKLWYAFRWAAKGEAVTGTQARRFDTGNREEDRLLDELRRIGCEVIDGDADGKQVKVRACGGHLRGKLDGEALGLPDAPATWHVVECKAVNEKGYKELLRKGCEKAKPSHYAQCQLYMYLRGHDRSLYIATNTNTDAIYAERVKLDTEYCMRQLARVERIVSLPYPPAKLHEDPDAKAAFACKWCDFNGVCHYGEFPRVHCRTCLHSSPLPGGDANWHCSRWEQPLGIERQREGCPAHLFIPDLVPGEQVDVDEAAETVTYKMADGSTWVDGGSRQDEPEGVRYWYHPESDCLFPPQPGDPDPRGTGADGGLVEELTAGEYALQAERLAAASAEGQANG